MSKFMFHIRFSNEGEFLHEHEIYEMMRSRNLYQLQFDLRRKLEKKIRTIRAAEKLHVATFQSRKTLFLQKAQDKIKLRNNIDVPVDGERESETEKYLPTTRIPDDSKIDKWMENNENLIPEPVDENPDIKNTENGNEVQSVETDDTRRESLTVTTAKVGLEFKGKSLSGRKSAGLNRSRNCFSEPAPSRPVNSNGNVQNTDVCDNMKSSSKKEKEDGKQEGYNNQINGEKEQKQDEHRNSNIKSSPKKDKVLKNEGPYNKINGEKETKQKEDTNNDNEEKKQHEQEENTTKPRPLYLTSTSNLQRTMTDLTTKSGIRSENGKISQGLLPKLDCCKPNVVKGRSKSSKNILSRASENGNKDLNMKTKEITFMLDESDGSSEKKPNLPPFLSNSENLVSKSLSRFEMGTVTPDGRILLTKDDYDQFLSKYRNAQKQRLRRSRRRSENLDQRVRDYRWNITEE